MTIVVPSVGSSATAVKYLIGGILGGLAGNATAWAAMPASTLIDDSWKYVWPGLAVAIGTGMFVARNIDRIPDE